MIIGIQAALTKLKAFVDSFTRADDGATLKASGTKNWQNIRGLGAYQATGHQQQHLHRRILWLQLKQERLVPPQE